MSEPRASRPDSPDWLGGSGLLPWSWAEEQLISERNYWLVSVRRDGFPQARPLWGVWLDGALYLSVGHAGLQRATSPEGDVTVHVDSAVDVVILEGSIGRTTKDDNSVRRAGEAYAAKYDYSADYVNFVMRPRVAYGWKTGDVKTATRWIFD